MCIAVLSSFADELLEKRLIGALVTQLYETTGVTQRRPAESKTAQLRDTSLPALVQRLELGYP